MWGELAGIEIDRWQPGHHRASTNGQPRLRLRLLLIGGMIRSISHCKHKVPEHLKLGGAGGTKWDTVLESWTDEDMMAVVKLRDQLRDGVIEVEGKVIED